MTRARFRLSHAFIIPFVPRKNDGFVIFPIARRLFFCYNLGGIGRRDAPEQALSIYLR